MSTVMFETFCRENNLTLEDGLKLFTKSQYLTPATEMIPFIGHELHKPPFKFWCNTMEPSEIQMSEEVVEECKRRLSELKPYLRNKLTDRFFEKENSRSRRSILADYNGTTISVHGKLVRTRRPDVETDWMTFCLSPIYCDDLEQVVTDHLWFDCTMTDFAKLQGVGPDDFIKVKGCVGTYKRYEKESDNPSVYVDYKVRAEAISVLRATDPVPIIRPQPIYQNARIISRPSDDDQ